MSGCKGTTSHAFFFGALLAGAALTAPVQAETLKIAFDSVPASLDPQARLSVATLRLSHMVFDPLVRRRRDFSFEPRLAERWQRLNPITVRFYLRRGVRFHSGNRFTARDVVWSFNRLKQSPDFKGLFAPISRARAIDEHTVDLVTAKPYPLVLNLASYLFAMDSAFYAGTDDRGQPKDALGTNGRSFAARHASGTGPFVAGAREEGAGIALERFAGSWDRASPGNVDGIELTAIAQGPARIAALLSGEVDLVAPVPPGDLERVAKAPGVALVTMRGTRLVTLQLNQKRVPRFKDRRVRQAIVYAVDNAAIAAKIMGGFATPAAQQSPPGYAGHDPALKPRFDLRQARDLMKEAGHEFGFKVTMMAPNGAYANDARIAEAVAAMLARIKIKVELKTLPQAQYRRKFAERAADIMMIGWQADTGDSAEFSEVLMMTPDAATGVGRYNSGNYSNPALDRLVLQTRTMTDAKARGEALREIERMLYEDAAFVPLHWQHPAWAARKGVHIGRVLNAGDVPYLGDLVVD